MLARINSAPWLSTCLEGKLRFVTSIFVSRLLPVRFLALFGGCVLTFVGSPAQVISGQQPLMRVLVLEAQSLRIRSDGFRPLLVSGAWPGFKKLRGFNLLANSGNFKLLIDGRSDEGLSLGRGVELRIKSYDPRGIWLGKRRYRGELRVKLHPKNLQVVNYLGVENYLESVVGSEMPKSWPMAALKAQAVAARTYALKTLGKSGAYDIKSSEANQVYLGVESETSSTRRAVRSTRSLVLVHGGKLINAVFHSSSGGTTEASGEVWKYQLPYLISVKDHDHHSPGRKWEKRFQPKQLRAAFQEIMGVTNIQVLTTSPTGRIRKAKVSGPGGNLVLTGKELRHRLGLKSTLVQFETSPFVPLKNNYLDSEFIGFKNENVAFILNAEVSEKNSLNMILSETKKFNAYATTNLPLKSPPLPGIALKTPPPLPPTSDNNNQVVLLAKGSGAGHGVGLSQWGAYGLAKKGANFREILSHFYQGVEIRPYKELRSLSRGIPSRMSSIWRDDMKKVL